MMSSNSQLPLLILSNSIYAKLADGGFYPGSIQAKHANSYVVKFPDGTEELVPEQHLTWLGFWGLPPWNWPKNPVILATPSCSEAIGGQTMAIRDNACPKNSMFVDSCTQQKTDITHVPSQSNDPRHLNANDCPGERICLPSHVLPPHTDSSQPRSSVLRMNSNMLSKEGRVEHSDYSIGLPRDQSNSANKSYHSLPQRTRTYYKEKQTDSLLYEKFTPFAAEETNKIPDDRRSTTRGQQDCEKSLQKDLEDDSAKRNRSFFDEVNTTHLIKEGEQDLSLTTSDSRSEYRIPSSEGYPQSPTVSNIFTPQHPFLCEPFGMTILAAPQHLASFRIQTRSRRKLEKKKCRKVYGVENKHFWCTQCKWKKACTRFSHRFMTNGVV